VLSDQQILSHIQRQPKSTAGYKQLMREMRIKGHERRELETRLRALVRRGDLLEIGRDRYMIPGTKPGRGAERMTQRAAEQHLVAGRLNMHRDGFGFVTPEIETLREQLEGDIYIAPPNIGLAMHGDRVLVEVGKKKGDGRVEGRIIKIAGRAQSTVVGTFHRGEHHNYVVPFDEKIGREIVIPEGAEIPEEDETDRLDNRDISRQSKHRVVGQEAKKSKIHDLDGVVVDVEITEWPTYTKPARGRVIEILGYEDDFGIDVEIIIRKHHLPHIFPDEVLEQAQRMTPIVHHSELEARHDYRALPIITIDGETARDFDDAVHVRMLANGNYELQVHIADVAQYVRESTPLDDEARLRGTSVYFPDRAVPMLPLELSTDTCSLRPNVERLVLSCIMEIDHTGEVQGYQIQEGIIRSAARMTYNNVQAILDGDAVLRREYSRLVEHIERARELAEILNRKRQRRGSIDFDLPEPIIEFDEQGLMSGVTQSERKFSHRLIEEFMLAANECVASYFEENQIAAVYRIHEKPSPKKIYDFEMIAASFGYSLGVGALPVKKFQTRAEKRERHASGRGSAPVHDVPEDVHITPRMYQKLTQKIAGTPEERVISFLMLRSLKQARYSEKNEGHFALAAPTYTHFTSPIRRYPDLIVHRILKDVIREREKETGDPKPSLYGGESGEHQQTPWSKQVQDHRMAGRRKSRHQRQITEQHEQQRTGPIPEHLLHDIAEESSTNERRADEAERELIEWKKIKFMADRIGEDFQALIISTTKFGFFVELTDMFIEGLVSIHSLIDDRYTYRENTRQIIGERTKRTFSIGDRVRVVLDRIDHAQRKLQFSLLVEDRREKLSHEDRAERRRLKQARAAERKQKIKTDNNRRKGKGKRR
jgi:ribonuclease R